MHKILLNGNYEKIHFIGIGGVSMSGLAEMLHIRGGLTVSGSDKNESQLTEHLRDIGIKIFIGHSKDNIEADMDLAVYTAAIKHDNEELAEARQRGIATIDRAGLLGQIMGNFKCPMSVAGSHGKTSTTSMLAEVFVDAGCDPTVAVGGNLQAIGGNIRVGETEFFIVETDEYCDSFLKFFPYIATILNIDMDHSDYFKDYDSVWKSFKKFAQNIPAEGTLILSAEVPRISDFTNGLKCRVVTYGSKSSDWYAENLQLTSEGCSSFDVFFKGVFQGNVRLNVVGAHNAKNALAVFAVSHEAGLDNERIIEGLSAYKGVDRRFQIKGQYKGLTVIDDYAHHPAEVKAALSAAKSFSRGKIYCAFQPHTYSRTKYFLDEFARSFEDADKIILTDIFAARENNDGSIHSRDLAAKISRTGKTVHYFESFATAQEFIISDFSTGDMLITMGAGNIYLLGESLVNR